MWKFDPVNLPNIGPHLRLEFSYEHGDADATTEGSTIVPLTATKYALREYLTPLLEELYQGFEKIADAIENHRSYGGRYDAIEEAETAAYASLSSNHNMVHPRFTLEPDVIYDTTDMYANMSMKIFFIDINGVEFRCYRDE